MDDPAAEHPVTEVPARGYERRDITTRPLVAFGVGLVIFATVVLLVVGGMFWYFAGRQARLDAPPSPLAADRQLPPEPRLQVAPAQDLKTVRAAEEDVLRGYGWADREAGIVRIPIDRAMELLAERGLPVRRPPAKAKAEAKAEE